MASFMESPRFPDNISKGVSFGPEFVTTIVTNETGYESRNRVRSRALSKGDCSHSVKTLEQYRTLLTFFRSVGGRYSGFRFKDWSDYNISGSNGKLVRISGTFNQYQINRLYSSSAGFEEYRYITKPVGGTLSITNNGIPLVVGASADQYSVDYTTGKVTIVPNQVKTVSTHTPGTTHTVVLSVAFSPQVAIGQIVTFNGVTGTAASLLNNIPAVITAVSGTTVSISINTTGLTATTGSLYFGLQTANLAVTCDFDVPARFDTDHMPAILTHPEVFDWSQIPIVEIIP